MDQIRSIHFVIPKEDRIAFAVDIDNILDSSYFTLGTKTERFEDSFSKYTDIKYATAFSCASAGIETLVRILNPEGGTVIVPTNTNFATPAAVLRAGGKVKFIDININTLSPSIDNLIDCIDKNVKGIILVHVGGIITPEILEIVEFCKKNDLFIIEDAAHAHGSKLDGQHAGKFSDGAVYSFHPGKLITCGEAGMLVTNNKYIYDKSLMYRDQGRNKNSNSLYLQHEVMGYSWRLSEISASLGYYQVKRIEQYINDRINIAAFYSNELNKIKGLSIFQLSTNLRFNFHKYIILLDSNIDNAMVFNRMKADYNIELSSFIYKGLCHQQPVFNQYNYEVFPEATKFSNRHICLPIHSALTIEQCEYIVYSLKSVLR